MARSLLPYGSWTSPITTDMIVAETVGFSQLALDGEDLYWVEMRPREAGRNVIVRREPDGRCADVTPAGFNARTRVHEYGGGAFTVHAGTVYFSNFDDQRLYRQERGGAPRPITPVGELRYADATIDARRHRLICVLEDHTQAGREAVNALAAVPLAGGAARVLVRGHDFYSSPCLSLDGTCLAWLTWDHPNLPWDGTELWEAPLRDDGSVGESRRVAGGVEESIFQPQWSPAGVLHFVSDRSGWWNLYRWRLGQVEALAPMEAEFGRPQWVFGLSTYAFIAPHRLACTFNRRGTWNLGILDTAGGRLQERPTSYTDIACLRAKGERLVFLAGASTQPPSVVEHDLRTSRAQVIRRASPVVVQPDYLSMPEILEYDTEHGRTAHAFFYPPRNPDCVAPPDERPPLLVWTHGGPTSAATLSLNLELQFWTSRGFAVLNVNYGGSTGYGRAYRQRLNGQWGIVDVDDCVNGARELVARGAVDRRRLAIRGGSAGGYTTLCALTFRDLFRAGASYFGLTDLEQFIKDTHKFESRYLDRLIGPYPERRDLYRARSPIHHTNRLSAPMIILQGLEDKIVPPNQAELLVAALRRKGLPFAYLPFEGEQHGFRRADSIKRALEAELYFYSRVFGFPLSASAESVPIENLPARA